MNKYLLVGIFTVVSCTPLLAASQKPDESKTNTIGSGNTCSPRSIKCPDGSTVVSYACGSPEEAYKVSCPK
jgi:hypothetical protein